MLFRSDKNGKWPGEAGSNPGTLEFEIIKNEAIIENSNTNVKVSSYRDEDFY